MFAFGLVALLLFAGCAQEAPQEPAAPEAPAEPEAPAQPEEPMPGSDRDEHGCIPSAGYEWCEPLQKCIRPWEENCTAEIVGGDKDEHGCIGSAGYTWCEAKQKCLREWEEPCAVHLNEEQALELARNSQCMAVGPITGKGTYNNNTYTWWFDLHAQRPGCSPACVVYEANESAEVNWRCTGLVTE